MRKPEIKKYPTKEKMAGGAATKLVTLASQKIESGGRFSVALSGGSTPKLLYNELVSRFHDRLDWGKVDFFWSDERYVPIDHPDSNMKLALDNLLRPLGIDDSHIYLIDTSLPPAEAAEDYQDRILAYFNRDPRFDLILLGLGADGHTASLFPMTKAVLEPTHWVEANYVPKLKAWRITFTFSLINSAYNVLFMAAGADKAPVVADIILKKSTFPAAKVTATDRLYWYLDKEAAKEITNTRG